MDVPLLLERLRRAYPDAKCALDHRSPFELLIATILSAQCTDARVNKVTPVLFERFPDPASMSRAERDELESIIQSTGFFRNKAKSIHGASERLIEEFGGEVPRTMEELLRLPGVARKTASVVLGVSYGLAEGVVVDTHVYRVSRRLGLTSATKVQDVERDLMRLLPHEEWIDYSHLIIFHGRRICEARKPKCPECPVADLCASAPYFLSGKIPPWERSAEAAPSPQEPARTRAASKAKTKSKAKAMTVAKPKARASRSVRQSKSRTAGPPAKSAARSSANSVKRSASGPRAAAVVSKKRPARRPRRGRP